MRLVSTLLFAAVAVLGAADCSLAQGTSPPQAQQGQPMQGAADWRERMQKNHDANRSIEQQVSRLTRDLELTAPQQEKVRQFAWVHHDRIQKILDTAPPTLTRQDFNTQVHAISDDFHNSVNAILTPHQLELMKTMRGRLGSGQENRREP